MNRGADVTHVNIISNLKTIIMKPVFKPGDKVKLIVDPRTVDKDWERWASQQELTVGDTYTVKEFFPHGSEGDGVRIDGKRYQWEAKWFELINS